MDDTCCYLGSYYLGLDWGAAVIDVTLLRTRLAQQLADSDHLKGADRWRQGKLGLLPRAILYSARSPIEASPQRQRIQHNIDIEIVVAPKSDLDTAMTAMTPLLQDTIDYLNRIVFPNLAKAEADGGLGVALHVLAYQQSERTYARHVYVTAILEVTLTEVSGEAYGT